MTTKFLFSASLLALFFGLYYSSDLAFIIYFFGISGIFFFNWIQLIIQKKSKEGILAEKNLLLLPQRVVLGEFLVGLFIFLGGAFNEPTIFNKVMVGIGFLFIIDSIILGVRQRMKWGYLHQILFTATEIIHISENGRQQKVLFNQIKRIYFNEFLGIFRIEGKHGSLLKFHFHHLEKEDKNTFFQLLQEKINESLKLEISPNVLNFMVKEKMLLP